MDRDLTPEGKKLWENIGRVRKLRQGKSLVVEATPPPPKTPKPIVLTQAEIEARFLREQVEAMLENSIMVVEDCECIIAAVKTKDEYLLCDAKVAKTIHERNIERLTRILEGLPAFE